MKKNTLKIIFIMLIVSFIPTCFAQENGEKQLFLSKNKAYLVIFNDKVQKFTLGDEKACSIELLNSIFNDKWHMLIKPKENVNTNLIVWTGKDIYNFEILVNDENKNSSKIIEATPPIVEEQLGITDLDTPPDNISELNISDFELDVPLTSKTIEGNS